MPRPIPAGTEVVTRYVGNIPVLGSVASCAHGFYRVKTHAMGTITVPVDVLEAENPCDDGGGLD